MMRPIDMIDHTEINPRVLFRLIETGAIRYAGNRSLKIYGRLDCRSGRRMSKENRVFFVSESAAIGAGYRPCGHCMREAYLKWKQNTGEGVFREG